MLLHEGSGSVVRRTQLPNGLRIITEAIPATRSVSFGVWVGAGSRDEDQPQHGAAHYLEHLLFKATPRRSAFEVNSALDGVGGEMNAFTSRETTCFYAHVLDEDLPIAVDVVLEVVTAGLMRDQDVTAERPVVLEEIAMHDDDPGDVAMEHFYQQVLGDQALARPILGTRASIEGLPGERIRQFYRDHYRPDGVVIAAAGSVDHDQVVALVLDCLDGGWLTGSGPPRPIRQGRPPGDRLLSSVVVPRPTEQMHVVIGGPSLPRNDPDKYALAVFNAVLGGGMASRLFTRVREERGLAYSVHSFMAPFADTGLFGIYAGTRPASLDEAVGVIRAELEDVAGNGLTAAEVARGKGAVRGARILSLEDPFARMSRLGHAELVVGELPPIDEIQRRIEAVTEDDVARVARRILGKGSAITVVGPAAEDWTPRTG